MPPVPPRRTILVAALAAVAAGAAGCTRAVRAIATPGSSARATGSTITDKPGPSTTPAVSPSRPAPQSATPFTTSHPPSARPSPATTARSTAVKSTTVTSTTARSPGTPPAGTSRPGRHIGPAVEVMTGPSLKLQVALTFHGAGDLTLARGILQIAAQRKARITVMAIGTWLEQNPQMAGEILAGGHELGNHTYSHLDINSLPAQEITAEIVKCRDILKSLTGSPGTYFRQSQAQHATAQVKDLAGAAGYGVCLSYDLDSMDYTDPGAAAVRANLQAATRGSIVSMHLGHQSTVDALPGVLEDLRAAHLDPVTVGTLLAG